MLVRRFLSFVKSSFGSTLLSTAKPGDEGKGKSLGRKAVSFVLITVTGGVALSALDDLSIYYGCSSNQKKFYAKLQKDRVVSGVRFLESGAYITKYIKHNARPWTKLAPIRHSKMLLENPLSSVHGTLRLLQ